jgi:signal transduction histidine kinase
MHSPRDLKLTDHQREEIAHEIFNPMGAAYLWLDQLEMRQGASPETAHIRRALERMTAYVKEITAKRKEKAA